MLRVIDRKDPDLLRTYLDSRSRQIDSEILMRVMRIIEDVQKHGDEALHRLTKQFDGVEIGDLRMRPEDIHSAAEQCEPLFKEAMIKAKENIEYYHRAQIRQSYLLQKDDGIFLGQRVLPLASCGIYVPGGRAQYPSTVLMNTIPAKLAGVERIVMVTPPPKEGRIDPGIAFAAELAGITEIYQVGGAQAIAALAYGTETIPPVDKIIGPGNIYVAAAKKLVYGKTDIDMIAGPSEILVIADDGADPAYIAADLLSQAEHDPMASPVFLTVSADLLDQVQKELEKQLAVLPKKAIAEASIRDYGAAILCDSLEKCIEYANRISPEHLELMVKDPVPLLNLVKNAGSVFLGYYTCESIGDYFGGTNHVLPTNGTARFFSALGVDAFVKTSSFLYYSEEALNRDAEYIEAMAEEEDLAAHARAVTVRKRK